MEQAVLLLHPGLGYLGPQSASGETVHCTAAQHEEQPLVYTALLEPLDEEVLRLADHGAARENVRTAQAVVRCQVLPAEPVGDVFPFAVCALLDGKPAQGRFVRRSEIQNRIVDHADSLEPLEEWNVRPLPELIP